MAQHQQKGSAAEVLRVFFRMGCIAFGGPAAHIALMEEQIVRRRQWLDQQQFLDLVGITNLIPGPNSTEMTMHCGKERAGIPGLFAAGIGFIFPAVLITALLAWLYVRYGQLPALEQMLFGIKPAVLAIILSAVYRLGKKAVKGITLAVLGLILVVLSFSQVTVVLLILGAGIVGLLLRAGLRQKMPMLAWPLLWTATKGASTAGVFAVFFKVGCILFGSGYVLLAYLDQELVQQLGWLSREELLDAIAIGQFTPGPVLSTATFIGYLINGWIGALAATAGIFLPSFFFVWLVNPLAAKMRSDPLLGAFLDAVNVAALGLMVGILLQMGLDVLVDWVSVGIASLAVFFTFGPYRPGNVWIIVGGGLLGYLLYLTGLR